MTVIIKRSDDLDLRRTLEAVTKQLDMAEEQNKQLMRENRMLLRENREIHQAIFAVYEPLRDYRDQKRLGLWYRRQLNGGEK